MVRWVVIITPDSSVVDIGTGTSRLIDILGRSWLTEPLLKSSILLEVRWVLASSSTCSHPAAGIGACWRRDDPSLPSTSFQTAYTKRAALGGGDLRCTALTYRCGSLSLVSRSRASVSRPDISAASASSLVACTTPSACSGGPYTV